VGGIEAMETSPVQVVFDTPKVERKRDQDSLEEELPIGDTICIRKRKKRGDGKFRASIWETSHMERTKNHRLHAATVQGAYDHFSSLFCHVSLIPLDGMGKSPKYIYCFSP
jgi:hypothetical protein